MIMWKVDKCVEKLIEIVEKADNNVEKLINVEKVNHSPPPHGRMV